MKQDRRFLWFLLANFDAVKAPRDNCSSHRLAACVAALRTALVALTLGGVVVACGGTDPADADVGDDVQVEIDTTDDAAPDALDSGDVTEDPDADASDAFADTDSELDTADSSGDTDDPDTTDVERDVAPPPCPAPPEGPEPTYGRWSLSTFHFNLQYVAGGMENFAEIAFGAPQLASTTDLTELEVEDRIVTESFVPVIEILERNPEVALTVELQGYMVDGLVARFPGLITRMQALQASGQLELASTHWSDQFFLAFGREEMDESWARTQTSFEAAGLTLSRAVFTQEGQFGPGFAEWLAETRPDAVMVFATNIVAFYQNDIVDEPYWKVRGVDAVVSRGLQTTDIDRQFSFFDDGELMATGDGNPYLGTIFARNAQAIATYERSLQCAVENGYRVSTLTDYIDALNEASFEPPEFPAFLDSTWQPQSTRGPLRWMGGVGDLWGRHEQDNAVLLACSSARRQVIALDIALETYSDIEAEASLDSAWRALLLGEVSDARGVNPWFGEVQYGLSYCGQAETVASDALVALRSTQAGLVAVDLQTRAVLDAMPAPEQFEHTTLPIALSILDASGRGIASEWQRSTTRELYRVELSISPIDGATERFLTCMFEVNPAETWRCDIDPLPVVISVPRLAGFIAHRPALVDRFERRMESDFSFDTLAYEDAAWVPAADGLVDTGMGYWIQDADYVHLAWGWRAGSGANDWVELRDETLQARRSATWVLYFTTDESIAVDVASRNLRPVVEVR